MLGQTQAMLKEDIGNERILNLSWMSPVVLVHKRMKCPNMHRLLCT